MLVPGGTVLLRCWTAGWRLLSQSLSNLKLATVDIKIVFLCMSVRSLLLLPDFLRLKRG